MLARISARAHRKEMSSFGLSRSPVAARSADVIDRHHELGLTR
jgi:hypothetical protein